jgi:mRNA-degrading endonuclease toxin of MazEF toxin-antitoxin module
VTYPRVRRWDLFRANLNPVVGREQAGESRPVLVVSNDGFNRAGDVVTVVPVTRQEGKQRRVYPYELLLPERVPETPAASIIMSLQVRTSLRNA